MTNQEAQDLDAIVTAYNAAHAAQIASYAAADAYSDARIAADTAYNVYADAKARAAYVNDEVRRAYANRVAYLAAEAVAYSEDAAYEGYGVIPASTIAGDAVRAAVLDVLTTGDK